MDIEALKALDSQTLAKADRPEFAEALSVVRERLLALPAADVRSPSENVDQFVRRTFVACLAARQAQCSSLEVTLRLEAVERLVLALARAQTEYIWESPKAADRVSLRKLLPIAERELGRAEQLAEELVKRGVLAPRQLPIRQGSDRDSRCLYALGLVSLFRRKRVMPPHELDQLHEIATRLHGAVDDEGLPMRAVHVRNRVYTLLAREWAAYVEASTQSGGVSPDEGITDVRRIHLAHDGVALVCA